MGQLGDARSNERVPSSEARSWAWILPLILTVFFGIVFWDIANSAWLKAIGTNGPLFSSQTSLRVYTATLTGSIIAALILVSLAASRFIQLNSRMRAVLPVWAPEEPRDRFPSLQSLRRARWLVWQSVAGPLVMLLIFIAISLRMLPTTEGFAQAEFQLNTGLVLFLNNGWPFLVAWTLAAIPVLFLTTRVKVAVVRFGSRL
jgi:hypothetical protein